MKVTPAEGRVVRDPITYAVLPPEGAEVDDTDLFWARRLRDGDVVAATDAEPKPAPQPDASHQRHDAPHGTTKQQGKAT